MKESDIKNYTYRCKMIEWLNKFDFKALLTVKYYNKQCDKECLSQLNKILSNMNEKIYGRNYKNNFSFINAVVAFEPDNIFSNNSFHNHVLIPNDFKISKYDINQLLDIAIKSSNKLKDKYDRKAFNHSKKEIFFNNDGVSGIHTGCIHLIENYSDGAANYITKTVKTDGLNLKFVDVNGLTDTDLSFLHQKLH